MSASRFVLLVLSLTLTVLPSRGQETPAPARGTLITAMGNKQGVVVMTDSRVSFLDEHRHYRPDPDHPIQKLVQYDDRTVCAIAGLWANAVRKPSAPRDDILPRVDTFFLGLVQSYRNGVRRAGKQQTMAETLGGLSAVIRGRFNVQADLDAYVGNNAEDIADKYRLELILAGTDTDGQQKIGRMDITVKRERWPDGQLHWTAHETPSPCKLTTIKNALFICSAGIDTTEISMRNNPERYTRFPLIRTYISAERKDHGASLSLAYLQQLGNLFKVQTSSEDQGVGGNDQIATMPKKGAIQLEGISGFPPFKEPVPITAWLCGPEAVITGTGEIIGGPVAIVFEYCTFSKFRVYLDGNIFVHCTFRDSTLFYFGGDNTLFEDDNRIEGASFLEGSPDSCKRPDIMEKLANRFDFPHGGNALEGPGHRLPACPWR
jgi:hypothetical protein